MNSLPFWKTAICRPALLCMILVWTTTAFSQPPAAVQPNPAALVLEQLASRANQQFGLSKSAVVGLDLPDTPGQPLHTEFVLDGEEVSILLLPTPVRNSDLKVLVQNEDGSWTRHSPRGIRTLRGKLVGKADSFVAGSLLSDGLHLRILLPDGEEYWLEPISNRVDGARAGQYLLYRGADVENQGVSCGTIGAGLDAQAAAIGEETPLSEATSLMVAELSCDADYEYYLLTFWR